MEIITLTPDEKRKFIAYLRQEEAGHKGMAEQLAKLPGVPQWYTALVRIEKTNMLACGHVADRLEAFEEQTIG